MIFKILKIQINSCHIQTLPSMSEVIHGGENPTAEHECFFFLSDYIIYNAIFLRNDSPFFI